MGHLRTACHDTCPNLRILYTQLQFFNTEDYGSKADRTDGAKRIVLEPIAGNTVAYRVRCGKLELEWPIK